MERLIRLRARITGLEGLEEVVNALRLMAASRLNQANAALPGARRFAEFVSGALAAALACAPAWGDEPALSPPRQGVLLFGSEHGFVGGFNAALAEAAVRRAAEPGSLLLGVGARTLPALRERGVTPAWSVAMATQRSAVPALARALADELMARFASGALTRLDLIFAESRGLGAWKIVETSLLPLDFSQLKEAGTVPPLRHLDPSLLIEGVAREYVFARLAQAALETLAAENAARLAAMSAALDNVRERLEALRGEARRLHQEDITAELLEVVTGAEVLLHPRA